jgi:hypothetical protein
MVTFDIGIPSCGVQLTAAQSTDFTDWKRRAVRDVDGNKHRGNDKARGHVTGEAGRLRVARHALAPAPDRYANAVSRVRARTCGLSRAAGGARA